MFRAFLLAFLLGLGCELLGAVLGKSISIFPGYLDIVSSYDLQPLPILEVPKYVQFRWRYIRICTLYHS